MTHHRDCFRSDGDWFCARACTHDADVSTAEHIAALEAALEKADAVADYAFSRNDVPFAITARLNEYRTARAKVKP
jgi:hypothetical protein